MPKLNTKRADQIELDDQVSRSTHLNPLGDRIIRIYDGPCEVEGYNIKEDEMMFLVSGWDGDYLLRQKKDKEVFVYDD